uniref:CUB domain-containing protein n=1 Tax=Steinernema glaseri TaxID=37863 RepID=A0A1I7ZQA0_9BILA
MLFGSDPTTRINVTEPLCVFIASSDTNGSSLEMIHFTMALANGSSSSISASVFTHWTDSLFGGDAVSFGKYCFDDETESIVLDHGDLYSDMNVASERWRETILLFLRKSTLKGKCKNGNVIVPKLWKAPKDVSASEDCPAFMLVPTLTDQLENFENRNGTSCPLISVNYASSTHLPPGVAFTLLTVQNGLRPINNTSIVNYLSSNPPSHDSQLLRNAVMLTTTSKTWTTPIKANIHNAREDGPLNCQLSRELESRMSGRIETDPYGAEEFTYSFSFYFEDPLMTFKIAPYDSECINLTLASIGLDGKISDTFNPNGTLKLTNMDSIKIEFRRTDPVKCAFDQISIRYNLSREAEVNPTDPPLTSKCIFPSQGAAISPDLPFMLFGSDNVSHLIPKEPMCVFAVSSDLLNMSSFAMTSVFANRSCYSVLWDDLSKEGKHCFDDSTETVLLHRGDIYDGYNEDDRQWRSAILLFLAKKNLKVNERRGRSRVGDLDHCQDGNVVQLNGIDDISASNDCPAFVLLLGSSNSDTICPMIAFNDVGLGKSSESLLNALKVMAILMVSQSDGDAQTSQIQMSRMVQWLSKGIPAH